MSDRPPTSVLLPTTRWTDACADLAAQLGDSDELLVIHDGEDDSVTEREDYPESVRLVAPDDAEHLAAQYLTPTATDLTALPRYQWWLGHQPSNERTDTQFVSTPPASSP